MTAQVADRVRYDGLDWSLVGISGSGLFDPTELGITPVFTTTANWRGYVCTYAVDGDRFLLASVDIGLAGEEAAAAEAGAGPLIDGRAPTGKGTNGWRYDLDIPLPFTGRLLLGSGFIQALYVHMGFHPAWKYERVTELEIEAGTVVRAEDQSARYAELRAREARGPLKPPSGSTIGRLREWIASTFDRSYRPAGPSDTAGAPRPPRPPHPPALH